MKRLLTFALLAASSLFLAGCLVRSSEPWLETGKITAPALAGSWQDAAQKMTVVFTAQGSNYQVRVVQEAKDTALFTAALFKLDENMLLVVGPAENKTLDAFVKMPVYLLFNAVLNGDTLQLFTLNLDAAPLRFRASTLSRSFTGSKEQGFLLTAPTEELSAFVRSQLNTPDFFQAQALFTLKRMTPTGGVAPVSGARTY